MCCDKEKNFNTSFFIFFTSLLVAIGIAGLFFASVFTGITITILILITLALGIIGLIYIIFTLFCKNGKKCYYLKKSTLIPAVIGALATSIIAIFSRTLIVGSESFGLFVIALTFFMVYLTIYYIICLVGFLCRIEDEC